MQSFHLTNFITSPLFLQELKEKHLPYDAIFSDIPYESNLLPYFWIYTKPTTHSLLPFRAEQIEKAEYPLIILESLSLASILPLLDKFPEKQITVINLYVGMGSLGHKMALESSDIEEFYYDIPKYEPLDAVNFFSILEQPSRKYIRIPHQHFPESIFSTEEIGIIDESILHAVEILSLKGYGYTGEQGTILTTGANFSTVLQLGDLLNEKEKHMDIFVLSKLTAEFTEEIISSLKITKKLIWISDFKSTSSFTLKMEKYLQSLGMKDIKILYFTPKYENLTTIFDEFSAEQAEFDAEGLLKRIIN